MRVLFIGDIFGKPGRSAVIGLLPGLRDEIHPDAIVANVENIAGGAGMTRETCDAILSLGVDALTSGNHVWDRKEIAEYLDSDRPVIRPLNFPEGTPGRGWVLLERHDLLVVNLQGRVFMRAMDDPFRAMDLVLTHHQNRYRLVDFHAEATAEKKAMGFYLDGRVGAVVGTHTHVPTADAQILPHGTAFISDVGMVGPDISVIGNDPQASLQRYLTPLAGRSYPASGVVKLNAVVIDLNDATGMAESIRLVCKQWPDPAAKQQEY